MRSKAKLVDCVRYQPIVDVEHEVVGYECLARIAGIRSPEAAIRSMAPDIHDVFASHLIQRICTELSRRALVQGLLGTKLFVNFEKNNLANPHVVDQIMFLSDFLEAQQIALVVEITERDLHRDRPRRAYLEGIRRLRLQKIAVALDDFLLDESSRVELELGLCSIVKVEVDALPGGINNILDVCQADAFTDLLQVLTKFKQAYGVELLLEKVEGVTCFKRLAELPFTYYQGFQFGSVLYAADF